jgi:hypothetical protein
MRAVLLIALVTSLSGAACAKRESPYRFRSPVVSSVRADELPQPEVATDASPPPKPEVVDTRNLGQSMADKLRSFVGRRDNQATATALALSILPAIGVKLDAKLQAVTNEAELLALAKKRNAVADAGARPLLGDLLLFEYREQRKEHALVGIVIAVRPNGAIEFLYLGNTVLRRGFLSLEHPKRKRDKNGDVLNTFVRLHDTAHSHWRGLAGDVFKAHLRLDRLAISRPAVK